MRVITLDNNRICEVKEMLPHYKLKENEMYSSLGEQGQVMNGDGTFSDYVPTQAELQAELDQKEIQELNSWLDLRRNIEHSDKAVKQARLLELLG